MKTSRKHIGLGVGIAMLALAGCGGGGGGGYGGGNDPVVTQPPPPAPGPSGFVPFIKAQFAATSDTAEAVEINDQEFSFDEDEAAYSDML